MNLDKRSMDRTIYGVLDWLGDIGGLHDALNFLAFLAIWVLQFNPLNIYLVSQLYRYDSSSPDPNMYRMFQDQGSNEVSQTILVQNRSDEPLDLGFWSIVKLTIMEKIPGCFLRKSLYNSKERAYFNAVAHM